jgi:O-antigen/teichoic acid export membrane protein
VSNGDSLGTKVARGVTWAAAAQAIIAIADLVSIFLVTVYWVSVSDFGVIGSLVPFYTALDYIADLGVSSALIQHDDHTKERVSTVFWFNLLVTLALFALLLGAGPLYAHVQDTPVIAWLLIAYGGKLLLQNLYAIPFALMRKELRFAEIAKARVVAHLGESIGRVLFAYLGFGVWCFTLAAGTRALLFGVAMQRYHPFVPSWVFKPREVISYVTFGARTAASNVLYHVYTSLDAPIVLYYFGPEASGVYWLADMFVLEPVKTIANVVIDVAFPTFAKLRTNATALTAQVIKFTRLNLMAVLPYTIVIFLVAPELLRLFWLGDTGKVSWTEANVDTCAKAVRILCVMGFFRSLGLLGPPLLDGVGRPDLTLRYMVVASIAVPGAFLIGALWLGPSLGLLSVAVAWAIGYPIAFAVLMYLVMSTTGLSFRLYATSTWGIIASCAAGGALGLTIDRVLDTASDAVRLFAMSAGALSVIAILFVTWQKVTPRSIAAALRGDSLA